MKNNTLKAKIRKEVLVKTGRETKISYLKGIGLFNETSLRGMSNTELNELVESAVQVKGF